jgi:CDP-paratose 2-epimerase
MRENYLIIGGAGFIGTNAADHYLRQGARVHIFDNFSRAGTLANAAWLRHRHGERLSITAGDIREDTDALRKAVENAEVVLHLAAQVAVTTSVVDPVEDFTINALGTLNVLESVRRSASRPVLLYSSTNKVYGKMDELGIGERAGRYEYADCPHGIPETRSLDFYSPYGCSKGCGDQYVLDYARIYGLNTVVFRQSCIYGPHQFGHEDQGWLAWFAIRAFQDRPVTLYGDGKQVRDALFVEDLIRAYDAAIAGIDRTRGQAYNIGGGPQNTLSLLELIDMLEVQFGRRLQYSFDAWRPGDQLVFVSDVRKAQRDFDWQPAITPAEGVARLVEWIRRNPELFELQPTVESGRVALASAGTV